MSEHFVDPVELQRKEGHDVKTLHPGPNAESWQGGNSLRAADGEQQSQNDKAKSSSSSQSDSASKDSRPHFSDFAASGNVKSSVMGP
ncbi:hypothetical protein JCM6882_003099 [Rhodosporidiobolus microsporus]